VVRVDDKHKYLLNILKTVSEFIERVGFTQSDWVAILSVLYYLLADLAHCKLATD